MDNPIEQELQKQVEGKASSVALGQIAQMAAQYTLDSPRLLGLLLKLNFAESHVVTCDPWKRNCGGIPRGCFVLFRIDPRAVDNQDREYCDRLILARITDAVPTPVETDVQQTLFQVHKLQAQIDPLTSKDLQWGALKASIIGTYYDDGDLQIAFGNDVDTFFSPFAYVAYYPSDDHLEQLINSFVNPKASLEIGRLRYTETISPRSRASIPILINPRDIVGEENAAQRLANFGKTRFGKSNSTKIIAQAIFDSGINVAQVFFDPSGEYTYITEQDGGTSLYAQNSKRSVRYTLSPKPLRQDEKDKNLLPPSLMRINFYEFSSVGHALIQSLWDTENSSPPGYMRPLLDWSPIDPVNVPDKKKDPSGFHHYWRTMGMYFALLYKAGFAPPKSLSVPITFQANLKHHLVSQVTGVSIDSSGKFSENGQPITVLPELYKQVANKYDAHQKTSKQEKNWFDASSDGSPYFSDLEQKLLNMFSNPAYIAHNYLRPFNKYHHPEGSSIFADITNNIANGFSVFIDMAQSNEIVRNNIVERVCREIFRLQNNRFISEFGLGEQFVMFHFEEAHRLFRSDDKDMNSIYNLLAKEGAKLNIAMTYSTQSMTTISPDLIKNTDNFLIAHLDDDREVKEVARKYVFRDVAEDVQRIQSKGYVRMITRSHRFALPVQIHKFGPPDPGGKS